MNDLRFALRSLAKSPGFTAVAVLTLALGIGLSTSSFSVANAFILRKVPYPEPQQLVRIFATSQQSKTQFHAPGNLIEVREAATSFSLLSIYNHNRWSLGQPGQLAEQVKVMEVDTNLLRLLGVTPVLGRSFATDEDRPDKPPVVVIPFRAWVRRYAADPDIVGRSVRLNTRIYTIVGVLPASFEARLMWGLPDFVALRTMDPSFRENRTVAWMSAIARLKPGVTFAQAQVELSTLAARLEQAHPKENTGRGLRIARGLRVSDFAAGISGNMNRSLLWVMTGSALSLLLITCANLASLQVARAFRRSREFVVRAALGGNCRQLMKPLLAESLVLSVAGGVGGLLVASWTNALVGSFLVVNGEPGFEIPLDGRVLAFAMASSVVSGIAFGLAPAWLAARAPAAEALKDASRSSTSSRSQNRLKHALIVVELALTFTLVGSAAAFGIGSRSFCLRPVGWKVDGLCVGFLALPANPYGDEARNRQFQQALLSKLAVIPGVQHAAVCSNIPLFSFGSSRPLSIEGSAVEESSRRPATQVVAVSAEYFAALQIPLKQGAFFPANLTEKDPPVAIVNESMARRFWPQGNAVGRRIRIGDGEQWIEIVGVVGDIEALGSFDPPETALQLYRPLIQSPSRGVILALRAQLEPAMLSKTVREALASLDPDATADGVVSERAYFERTLANHNLAIASFGVSAGMGLLIAAIGLFGVISQLTLQRTRDIGVRLALGAGKSDILRMVLGDGFRLMTIGIAAGIPAYYALTTVLHRMMPAMRLPGLWLLAMNVALLGATMLLACWLPARRATRVNPVEALRAE